MKKDFLVKTLPTMVMNFKRADIEDYEETVSALARMGLYSCAPPKVGPISKNRPTDNAQITLFNRYS